MKKVLSLIAMAMLCVAAWAGSYSYNMNATSPGTWAAWQNRVTSVTTEDGITITLDITNNMDAETSNVLQSNHVRIYSGTTFAIACDEAITKVVLHCTESKYAYNFTVGEVSSSKSFSDVTWEGETTEFVATASGQTRVSSIEIETKATETPAEPEFVFTPAAGTYTAAQNVAVTVNNKPENCFMQVKFVGDTEIDWMRAESYNVTESGELYARLVSSEDYETVIATSAAQAYVINIPEPTTITFNPAAGEVEAGTQVTVTAANVPAGMKLFARQDNGSWSKYITTFTVNAASTIQAAVLDENTDESEILWYMIDDEMKAEANYTIMTAPVEEPTIVFNPEAGEYEAGTQVTVSAENVDYDYIIEATYGDVTKQGQTVTFELTETGNIVATIMKWSDSMDDYVATSVTGSARYTVVAPEPTPVITFDPDGGSYNAAQTVTVTVENMPSDAEILYEFVPDEEETTGEMYYRAPITVDKTGTLYVKVVREEADPTEEAAPRRVKTGVLAEKTAYYVIDKATGIEALTAGKAVKSIRYYNVAGQQANSAFHGVNIVVVDYQDGTQAVAKVVK